jgi:hypothetical protein
MNIATADATGSHADQDFLFAGLRLRLFGDRQLSIFFQQQGFH